MIDDSRQSLMLVDDHFSVLIAEQVANDSAPSLRPSDKVEGVFAKACFFTM